MNPYASRRIIIAAVIIAVFFVYLIRLFYLQLIDKSYLYQAESNSHRYVTQYPARGLIFDRNGKLMVCNKAAYDIMINPPELKSFDTTLFCSILSIEKKQLVDGIKAAKAYSRYKPSLFIQQISDVTYAYLQESMYQFPGFFVQTRTLRKYEKEIAPHIFGYVGEVDSFHIKKNPYYKMGDYIGYNGLEKKYEDYLKGRKGVSIFLVDVHNRIKGSYANGMYDTTAIIGQDLTVTIDADLQEYGEKLMRGYTGSVVAIEPSTGEVLCMVSMPDYNPSLLVGRERSINYRKIRQDQQNLLFNRALMAKYPPGSTFKIINALIGQQEGLLHTDTRYSCSMGYTAGRVRVGCHAHSSPLNLPFSISNSCNAYYCHVFRNIIEDPKFISQEAAFINWRSHVMSFGFGKKLNTDFTEELRGNVPSTSYYDRYYGRGVWKSLTIISLAIGQGEMGTTPLQMANMAASLANRGHYYTPHILKKVGNSSIKEEHFLKRNNTTIEPRYYEDVVEGMMMAVNGDAGSTARIAKLDSIIVCGKTGTAQNPHGEDHSIFIAFAPKDNPKIAIAVYVENAGFGATYAAPVASLLIEKYLNGKVADNRKWVEDRIINSDLKNKNKLKK